MAAGQRWPAELIGGHPALDLVNTVSWRLDAARTIDRLPDNKALVLWASAVGLLDTDDGFPLLDAMSSTVGDVTRSVRELRDSAYAVLSPIAIGDEPDALTVGRLQVPIGAALSTARIVSVAPLRWTVGSPIRQSPMIAQVTGLLLPAIPAVADLAAMLALVVWRLLEDEPLDRLKQCQDGGCGWLFLDRSKNSSRRWCSSADCGNRSRARRHYERHREA